MNPLKLRRGPAGLLKGLRANGREYLTLSRVARDSRAPYSEDVAAAARSIAKHLFGAAAGLVLVERGLLRSVNARGGRR